MKIFAVITIYLIALAVMPALAQTTEFTYQGKLNVSGTPASSLDFEFRLCATETETCSTPLAVFAQPGVSVSSSGIFSVGVNFGFGAFNGADRYIEIGVRRTGETSYTTLSPRQRLTSVPYAQQSLNATFFDNRPVEDFVLENDPRLQPNFSVLNTTTMQPSVNFNIGGTGTASILNAGTQFNLGGSRILSNEGQQNLFAGINAGAVTTGGANAFFGNSAGIANTTGDNNAFFGASSGSANTVGRFNAFFGTGTGPNNSSGSNNSFIGQSSGSFNSSGSSNSFFGASAGTANFVGSNNTIVGAGANLGNTNLNFATALGSGATVGTSNTLVLGRPLDAVQAPGSLSVGSFINAATQYNLGGNRFMSNNAMSSNTFVGVGSNCVNGTGNANTFIGNNTGSDCTTGAGNTVVGSAAGNVGSGFLNTLIGTRAQVAEGATVNNSTAIGVDAVVSTSNTIVLGRTNDNARIPGEIKVIGGANGNDTFPALMTVDSQNSNWGYGIAVGSLHIDRIPPVFLDTPLCFQSGVGVSNYKSVGLCPDPLGPSSLKSDAKPFTGGIEIVKRLQPISFKWKEHDSTGIGLNAEEVAAVDAQLISRDENGEISKVSESSLNAVLINAVKEQQAQIEQQQKQIKELKQIVCVLKPEASICSR